MITQLEWRKIYLTERAARIKDVNKLNVKIAALEADAARFRSLQWRFDAERDSGPGGRWTATVHTDNPRIRNNVIAVIDDAMKGGA